MRVGIIGGGIIARLFIEHIRMAKKQGIGDTFPNVTLNLVKGSSVTLPEGIGAKYGVVLFYRGHW
jgi:hypothetical protein